MKAITKGMAIATAVIAATSLFGSFEEALKEAGATVLDIRVNRPDVLVGLLAGGTVAFLFSSLAIRAVGRAAMQVVVEVRNQFRNHPGLIAVLTPVAFGFFLGAEGLGAFLAGSIVTGQLLAVMLSNSGGAWDNSKKYIEEGHFGGKGSEAHKAAVIGDTVGDPFKDTAGPALNPLIKVMNLVALLIAPIVVRYAAGDAGDTAVRITGAVGAPIILGGMFCYSKSRRSELMVEEGTY